MTAVHPATPATPFQATRLHSRIGEIVAVVDGAGALVYLDFEEKTGPTPAPGAAEWRGHPVVWCAVGGVPALKKVADEIADYFAGKRTSFEGLGQAQQPNARQPRSRLAGLLPRRDGERGRPTARLDFC